MKSTSSLKEAGRGRQAAHDVVLLDVSEVAKMLACSARHVRRTTDRGAMPCPVRIGSLVRWRRTDIERWIADGCPNLAKRKGAK